jgi:hypothetical protein
MRDIIQGTSTPAAASSDDGPGTYADDGGSHADAADDVAVESGTSGPDQPGREEELPWLTAGAGADLAGALVPSPQKKFAAGTGPWCGGRGCLAQCDSIQRTRGSGPDGDTGSTNTRT